MTSLKNTFTTQKHFLYGLPSGHHYDITSYNITGQKPGPHVYLQASVHGSELQGSLVLMTLIDLLKEWPLQGQVTLVPLANPLATNNKHSTFTQGRFSPLTGENWNRLYDDVTPRLNYQSWFDNLTSHEESYIRDEFKKYILKSLEEKYKRDDSYGIPHDAHLAFVLQSIASQADIVLDLHTGPSATHYMYAPEHLKTQAKDLNFPFRILIPSSFAGAMDESCFTPWYHLEELCKKKNITLKDNFESYTLELGSEEVVSTKQLEYEVALLLQYFIKRGLINQDPVHTKGYHFTNESCILENSLASFKTYYLAQAGLIEYLKKPGDFVSKGENLYLIYRPLSGEKIYVSANHDGHIINHTTSCSLAQGCAVYQILEK